VQRAKLSSKGKTCKVTPIEKGKKRERNMGVKYKGKEAGAKMEVKEDEDSNIIDVIN
jgi:hypothetical protein